MVADDGPHVVDADVLRAEAAADLVGHEFGVRQAVAVADEHRLVLRVDSGLFHLVHQRQQGGLPAPGLADGDQAALVIHVHDGLDGQHGAEQGRGGVDAAAPLQVVQVVHGEPVAHLATGLQSEVVDLIQRAAPGFFLGAEVDEQALAQRGAQGIHHQEFGLRPALRQLLGGNDGGLVGGGQGGGEAQAQHVLPLVGGLRHGLLKSAHADGGGGGGLPGADALIEIVEANFPAVQVIVVGGAAHLQAQGNDAQPQLLGQLRRQVAAAVGQNDEITHISRAPFLFSPCPGVPPPAVPAGRPHTGCWLLRRRS